MLIAGAGGHAIEILDILFKQNIENIFFYDDTINSNALLFDRFKIINSLDEVIQLFKADKNFVLGTGNVDLREYFFNLFNSIGGKLCNVVAENVSIGIFNNELSAGLNLMERVSISSDVKIGKGSLINRSSSIHHHVIIGDFCEIGPGSVICGRVKIGNKTSIGASVTVLPNIEIGNHVIIGAGSVVTKNLTDFSIVAGVPAKPINSSL